MKHFNVAQTGQSNAPARPERFVPDAVVDVVALVDLIAFEISPRVPFVDISCEYKASRRFSADRAFQIVFSQQRRFDLQSFRTDKGNRVVPVCFDQLRFTEGINDKVFFGVCSGFGKIAAVFQVTEFI